MSDTNIGTGVWPPGCDQAHKQFVSDFTLLSRERLTLLVDNPDDSPHTVSQLNAAISDRDPRRVLLRPTPGRATHTSLALDLLMALGKSAQLFDRQRLGAAAWNLAAAWLTGYQVTDLIVDRSHQLSPDLVNDLVRIARGAGASVWR